MTTSRIDEIADGVAGLEAPYRATAYRVYLPGGTVEIRIGEVNGQLDAFLAAAKARDWAFISAVNPASRILPAEENAKRHAGLCHDVGVAGLSGFPGEALADAGDWPTEAGLLILDMDEQAAREAGRRFGQNAVVWGARGEPSRLVWCL